MIRVGIVLSTTDKGWLGGLNYIANLCQAVLALKDRQIEPVLFVSPKAPDDILAGFGKVEIIRTDCVASGSAQHRAGKVLERTIGRNLVMETLFARHRIGLLSHSTPFGRYSRMPSIVWIPDFQHHHLPEMFTAKEISRRNKVFLRMMAQSDQVLLSSRNAQVDLKSIAPQMLARSRVLNFVSGMGTAKAETDEATLRERYGIDQPYFYLPNQFWRHKNHATVLRALAAARKAGSDLLVVATGRMRDDRNPDHVANLRKLAADLGVEQQFMPLGVVPIEDVFGLYRHAIAVINPSLFEGWSSSVEEAKSMGKTVILSDIPVHREQAPHRGLFFAPEDPQALCAAFEQARREYSTDTERLFIQRAETERQKRFHAFGRAFQDIVLEVMEGRR